MVQSLNWERGFSRLTRAIWGVQCGPMITWWPLTTRVWCASLWHSSGLIRPRHIKARAMRSTRFACARIGPACAMSTGPLLGHALQAHVPLWPIGATIYRRIKRFFRRRWGRSSPMVTPPTIPASNPKAPITVCVPTQTHKRPRPFSVPRKGPRVQVSVGSYPLATSAGCPSGVMSTSSGPSAPAGSTVSKRRVSDSPGSILASPVTTWRPLWEAAPTSGA